MTDRRGRVAGLPWRVVRQARIAGTEPIPLLVDLLTAWPDGCINLDVKAEHSIGPTIEAIRRTGRSDRVCVGAFSDAQSRRSAVRSARSCAQRWAAGSHPGCAPPPWSDGFRFGQSMVRAHRCLRRSAGRVLSTGTFSPPRTSLVCLCTSGLSTTPRKWLGCSTWGLTE